MNQFIKALKKNTRLEGWNNKKAIRYPNSECDAFTWSESNEFLCLAMGWQPMSIGMIYHKAIWRAHSLADRCYKNTDKYFKHPTGRSYFNPWYRRAHQKRVDLFFERIMIRELAKEDARVLKRQYHLYVRALKEQDVEAAVKFASKYNDALTRLGGPEKVTGEFYLSMAKAV